MFEDFSAVEVTLKNYRCFPDTSPAKFTIRNGFTSFVGINNTGKSTILKFFFEFRPFFQIFASEKSHLTQLNNHQINIFLPKEIKDFDQIFYNGNNRDIEVEIVFIHPSSENRSPEVRNLKKFKITVERNQNFQKVNSPQDSQIKVYYILASFTLTTENDEVIYNGIFQNENTFRNGNGAQVDITPALEMVKAFSNMVYIGPFRNAINIGANESYYDIQVGQAMIKQWREWKTGDNIKANRFATKISKDIRNIFGFDQLEINPSSDDQTLQININEDSYKLAEIGSGLAQFFIVLANAANKQPSFVLIDEPELNLHPSLQLDFLTTIASYSTHGVLFSTHNYGLARAISQQIFLVEKTPKGNHVTTSNEITSLSEFLGELGFNAYHDLGFDKVLLVEGPSDLVTMQQFLKFYQKEHKILLIHLGGASSINGKSETMLEEIKRITNNVSAIVDSEKPNETSPLPNDRQDFNNSCHNAGINLCILERRALENYFTEEAIRKVFNATYNALTPYQLLKDVKPRWGKVDDWRIAREMKKEDLDGTDLGEFLEKL